MSFRVTTAHWEIIISFMERHPDLAKGFMSGPSGKDTARILWEELTTILNAAGLGERSTKKWQKTWTDFKHILKKKAAEIKNEINATGGGPPSSGTLSDIEKRFLCILGPTFYKGVGRPENGVNFENATLPTSSVNDNFANSFINVPHVEVPCSSASKEIESTSYKEIACTKYQDLPASSHNKFASLNQGQSERSEATRPSKRPLADHDYVKSPIKSGPKSVKSTRQGSMEDMYIKTLNELKDIKESLQDLTNCAKGIESALDKIANHIGNT